MSKRLGAERRTWNVAALTLVLFALMAGHALLETARDGLFLSSLPALHLPLVYLAIALGAAGIAKWWSGHRAHRSHRNRFAAVALVASVVTALFWLWIERGAISLYGFYVWTGLIASIAVVELWLVAGAALGGDHVKRSFAIVGGGGLVGATVGSASATLLLRVVGPSALLVVATLLFACAGALVLLVDGEPSLAVSAAPDRQDIDPDAVSPPAATDGYLRKLVVAVVLSQAAVTLADLVFKVGVTEVVAADRLPSFFALFYTGINCLSLVVQVVVASWLLPRIGVNRTLRILPLLLGLCSLGFAATAAFLPLLLLKMVDGSLRHSLHRTSLELLYLPLSLRQRELHKVKIDAAFARGGQALAALLVFGGLALGFALSAIALVLVVVVAALLVAIAAIKANYVIVGRRDEPT